ncbi:Na+/H+ antiporter subunit E [Sulfitobacter sp. PR48]|jgi:multicomponent K+:H+ antiporter subunit E|uniref:Na+/H+ antiporter subunit E n=1 Tax=unclassified Sulfitobacter TaxID=196795 RepID=UPI0022AFC1D8|nr:MULTISPECIES: Na+/H+ antiporter subunit E [unclassified Sulfitobacter]MCZ4254601.1 Na+/H+ antiporter subunit E [Sulfitobacter sp. G21635-S1]MDD9720232.1 Na+/H+ antiporter subunit E [Sulfitobacter sp. PR48]GLT09251.1 Na+/H+ antiporter subunit E [Sulfitobacter porphyrae]
MMRALRWLLPHPFLTLLLVVVWTLLQNGISAGMVVFGLILGIVIPIGTAQWWPDRPGKIRVFRMLSYCLLVMWDILVANVQVAWIVLTKSNAAMRPAWVVVPLDLRQPEAITILAGTITLTPGTVSADLSDEGHSLLVHALDAPDPDAVRDDIKHRYERRLKEIFA